jgi:hypothetical protein
VRPYPPPDAESLLARVREQLRRASGLRAETKVDHLSGEGRIKGKVTMLVAADGRLRFEAESPLGSPLAVLASDGTEFDLLDVEKNRFLTGPATPCNVARLLRIVMPGADVAAVLLGGAPLPPFERARVEWDDSHGGRERLILDLFGGGRQTLWLGAGGRTWDVVAAERVDAAGRTLFSLEHEGFRDVGRVRLPRVTRFREPAEKADVIVRWREQEAGVELPAAAFRLPPPEGIPAERVTCP